MSEHRSSPTGILRWRIDRPSPVLAIAPHAGHEVRPELLRHMVASEAQRHTEEDPGTERLLAPFPVAVHTRVSRFEVDLNRPRYRCAYTTPDTCWGIRLYDRLPPPASLERSRQLHDEAWAALDALVDDAVERFGFCVLLDFHSYCYRREDPAALWWEQPEKPVFNLGTRGAHPRFRALNVALLDALRPLAWQGRPVTVGENVVFGGGTIHRHQQDRHPGRVVVPSLELVKVFMDERSGVFHEPDFTHLIERTTAAWVAVLDRLPSLLPELAGDPGFRWR
jgi:N-formylglutamate deformylase